MNLKDWKEATGKTYRQLAEEIHIPPSTLHRICRGHRPSMSTAEKLLKIKSVSIDSLISGGGK